MNIYKIKKLIFGMTVLIAALALGSCPRRQISANSTRRAKSEESHILHGATRRVGVYHLD